MLKPESTEQPTGFTGSTGRPLSLWMPLGMQVLVSVLMLAGAVLAGWSRSVQVSLFWGAAACVVPSLLCLLGYLGTGQMLKRMPQAVRARLGLLSVVFWESVKLLLSVVFLLGTHFLVKQLNWMALLVAFIVVVKTFWLAALVDHLRRQRVQRVLKTGI